MVSGPSRLAGTWTFDSVLSLQLDPEWDALAELRKLPGENDG